MDKSDSESQDLQELEREESIELAIPPSNDSAQLYKFMAQLENTYNCNNHSARIASTAGSFDRGVFIIISPGYDSPTDIINKISRMPEVEKVEEDPPSDNAFSHFAKMFARLRSSNFSHNNRVRITLNGTSRDRQKLATV